MLWRSRGLSFLSCTFGQTRHRDSGLVQPSLCVEAHNDGYGESLEQRPIKTADGEIYVSFWDSEGFSIALKAADYNYAPSVGYLDLPATQPEILDAMDRARVRDGQKYTVEIRDVHRDYLCPLMQENPSL